MWIIRKTLSVSGNTLYEVGYYFSSGWSCFESYVDKQIAVMRCHYLNGGN